MKLDLIWEKYKWNINRHCALKKHAVSKPS